MLIIYMLLILTAWILWGLASCLYHLVYLVRISLIVDEIDNKQDLLYLKLKDFEYVIAEIFKRKGYRVKMSDHFGEGGTGIILNNLWYVQVRKECYHHRMEIEQAKKLARHMRENGIYRGMMITLGDFKKNTKNYCHTHVITCINGNQLLAMCRDVHNLGPDSVFERMM